jgi:hypothetical protein
MVSPSGEGWGEGAIPEVNRAAHLGHTLGGVSPFRPEKSFTLTLALSRGERE